MSIFAFLSVFAISTSALATYWDANLIKRHSYRLRKASDVPTVNAWDMTCKKLQNYVDSLKDNGLPGVFYANEAGMFSDKQFVLSDGFRSCARYGLLGHEVYRIHTANRYCRIQRCGYDPSVDRR